MRDVRRDVSDARLAEKVVLAKGPEGAVVRDLRRLGIRLGVRQQVRVTGRESRTSPANPARFNVRLIPARATKKKRTSEPQCACPSATEREASTTEWPQLREPGQGSGKWLRGQASWPTASRPGWRPSASQGRSISDLERAADGQATSAGETYMAAEGSQLRRRVLALDSLEVDQRLPSRVELVDLWRIDCFGEKL